MAYTSPLISKALTHAAEAAWFRFGKQAPKCRWVLVDLAGSGPVWAERQFYLLPSFHHVLGGHASNDFSVWCVAGLGTTAASGGLGKMPPRSSASLQLLHTSLGLTQRWRIEKGTPLCIKSGWSFRGEWCQKHKFVRARPGVKWMLEEPRIFIVRGFQSADSGSPVVQLPGEGKVIKDWRQFQTNLVAFIYILFSLLPGRPWRSLKSRAGLVILAGTRIGQRKCFISHPSPGGEVAIGNRSFLSWCVFFNREFLSFPIATSLEVLWRDQ